ncbi:MAG: cupin domain-containing protein [Ignavibacteriaceae bacterium]|nr:cupin domain-containing protein [Ignavibacteriaceae bacterium]
MIIKSKENAEHFIWGEICDGWHLVKTPTLSIIQERVSHGCSEVRHYHEKAEQYFFILSGEAEMEVDGKINILKRNQGIHIPAGIIHKLGNKSKEDLEFLVTSTPPSHGDRVLVEA